MNKKIITITLLMSLSQSLQAITWQDVWAGIDAFLKGYSTAPGTIGGSFHHLKTSNGGYRKVPNTVTPTSSFEGWVEENMCKKACQQTYSVACTACVDTVINLLRKNKPRCHQQCVKEKPYAQQLCTDICDL